MVNSIQLPLEKHEKRGGTVGDFTPERVGYIRLNMYRFSRRIGLNEIISQISAQNAADAVSNTEDNEGHEEGRENAKRIYVDIHRFCVETLGYSETQAELIARHAAFCGDILTTRWWLPSNQCDLPRGHLSEYHEDSRGKYKWTWNPPFKRVDVLPRSSFETANS